MQMHALLRMAADQKLELRTTPDGGIGYGIPGNKFLPVESYSELGVLMRAGHVELQARCCHVRMMALTESGWERLDYYDRLAPDAGGLFREWGVMALPVDAPRV